MIKIDVQGWEKKVLKGCVNLLQSCKPVIIIEFESHQLLKTGTTCEELFVFIRQQGYYIYYLEFEYPSDHICVHNDNLEEFEKMFEVFIKPHTINNNLNNNIKYGVNKKISLYLILMSEQKILNNSENLIVCFGGMAHQSSGIPPFEFLRYLSNTYTNVDKKQSWYHKGIDGISRTIDETIYKT